MKNRLLETDREANVVLGMFPSHRSVFHFKSHLHSTVDWSRGAAVNLLHDLKFRYLLSSLRPENS